MAMVILVPKALRGVLTLVAIDLAGQRADARLKIIDKYVTFARKYRLVTPEQETELVEMLLSGARLEAAIAELRVSVPYGGRQPALPAGSEPAPLGQSREWS